MSFDDFYMTTWEQENESKRKKEPQIPRLSSTNNMMTIVAENLACSLNLALLPKLKVLKSDLLYVFNIPTFYSFI